MLSIYGTSHENAFRTAYRIFYQQLVAFYSGALFAHCRLPMWPAEVYGHVAPLTFSNNNYPILCLATCSTPMLWVASPVRRYQALYTLQLFHPLTRLDQRPYRLGTDCGALVGAGQCAYSRRVYRLGTDFTHRLYLYTIYRQGHTSPF